MVDMMGDIYSRADRTYAWLGPGTVESDRVLDFVVHMGPRAYTPTAFAASLLAISRSNHNDDLVKWMVPEVKEYLMKRWDFQPEQENILEEVKGAEDIDRRKEVNGPEERNLQPENIPKSEDMAEQEDIIKEETIPEEDSMQEQESSLNMLELSRLYEDLLNEDGLHSKQGMEVLGIERPIPASIGGLISGIGDILSRSYWSRIWIIQEVSLGREVELMCGERRVSIDVFDAVFSAIWACRNYRPCHHHYLSYAWDLDDNLYSIKALMVRRLHARGARVRLMDILFEPGPSPGRPYYSASDPRDILFGLLGITSDAGRFGLHADYTKSVEAVFAALTATLIRTADEQEDSDCTTPFHHFHLDWCPPHPMPSLLPSWVPDWQAYGTYGIDPSLYAISYSTGLNATKNMAAASSISSNGIDNQDLMVLRRRGCCIDVITEVMAAPEMSSFPDGDISSTEADTWLKSVLKFAGLGPEPGPEEDHIWRSIIRNDSWQLGFEFLNSSHNEEKDLSFVRKIMRGHYIGTTELSPVQQFFVYHRNYGRRPMDGDDIAEAGSQWRRRIANIHRFRTVFKTSKGMFGVCYLAVEPGDIVTLLWGINSPIILMPRQGGGYYFKGDAYIDGIMDGEFLETNPIHEDFDIH